MKKFLYTLALAGLVAPVASARTLSVDEAKANVVASLGAGMKKVPALDGTLKLARVMTLDGMPTLYLFTGGSDGGLVVASASSEAMPVLGYVGSGNFDAASIPPAMQALLDDYSAEIARAEAGEVRRVYAPASPERAAIEPLCKTQWNQNAPYNDLTPEIGGQHSMTGCVATAMAQVMKVFEWPAEHGEGFVSYRWAAGGKQLSYNLANSVMDWAGMLDNYHGENTADQRQAVASLMRDCGYATEMQYSLTSSGTTANRIPTALCYNFGYDKGVHTLQRSYFTLSEWEDIVYGELQAGHPVIFTGVSSAQGGHCFVCDGYSSDRYYHINWGWGGLSDGYFLLSALDPEQQGIGGSTSGFNNYVNICVGIQKPVEGSEVFTEIIAEGNLATGQPSYPATGSVTFKNEAFYNPTMETENLRMGVKLTDAQGEVSYIGSVNGISLDSYEMVTEYSVEGSSFPTSGTYTVTAAWYNTDTEQWNDVHFPIDKVSSLRLTAADGQLEFEAVPVDYDVRIENVKILTDLYGNANFRVSADVVNSGDREFLSEVMAALTDADGEVVALTAPFSVDIEGGRTRSLEYVTRFTQAPAAGEYRFCYITADGRILSEPFDVTVGTVSDETSVTLQNLRFISGNGGNRPVVPSNNVSVAGSVYCVSGYYSNTLTAYIFPERGGDSLGTIGAETLFVHAGESEPFEMKGSFGNGMVGQTYMIGFFNGNVQINGVLYFILGDEDTGISMVESPEGVSLSVSGDMLALSGAEMADIDVYSVSGAHVLAVSGKSADISSLAPGTYVAVARTTSGPVMTRFVR